MSERKFIVKPTDTIRGILALGGFCHCVRWEWELRTEITLNRAAMSVGIWMGFVKRGQFCLQYGWDVRHIRE